MKVTGSLVSKAGVESDDPSNSRHYMCCLINIYTNGNVDDAEEKTTGKKIRKRYEEKQRSAVKWLSGCQIFLGLMILCCQIAPSYYFFSLRNAASSRTQWLGMTSFASAVPDIGLPGVWAGTLILATGIVGLIAALKNARCLIVAHLVLNSFVVLCALAAAVMAGMSLVRIADCKVNGSSITIRNFQRTTDDSYNGYSDDWKYYETTTTTTNTTTPSPVVVWDQVFTNDKGNYQRFYCTDNAFTVWIVMESVIVLGGLVAFGLTIGLIVKNSKALSLCCRRCCTVEEEIEGEADDACLLGA